jgi:hypothetical protein
MKHQDLNHQQARWAQYLSRFNFKWLHKAGATIGKADALSRREDHSIGIEKDNTGVLVIPPDQIRSVTEVHIATDANIIIDMIKDILFDLKKPDLIPLQKQYVLKDCIFYDKNGKLYVLKIKHCASISSNYTMIPQSPDSVGIRKSGGCLAETVCPDLSGSGRVGQSASVRQKMT